jgi:ectoine hydroxylase-related dioxygenase (phytanoyl-CoA dioxygenase family)
VKVSPEEQRQGALDREKSAQAIAELTTEGYVVLEDCLPPALTEELSSAYAEAFEAKRGRLNLRPVERDPRMMHNDRVRIDFRPEGGNHDLNRWNMHLPSRRPFLDPRLIANPIALDVIDARLGGDCVLTTIASDTPLPGAGFQNIHQDDDQLRIALNVPLVDLHEDNAPIEVWPRSHRPDPGDPAGASSAAPHQLKTEELSRLSRTRSSKRLLLRAGSFLIRDQRLVHRGTAHRSSAPRPMLTLLYFPAPRGVPYRSLSEGTSRLARSVRERARRLRPGLFAVALADAGNSLGRAAEYLSGSDRDHRRPIPAELFHELPPRAKRLLRFASVDGPGAPLPREDGSVGASLELLLYMALIPTATLIKKHLRGRPQDP